jgi:hypothetical protein
MSAWILWPRSSFLSSSGSWYAIPDNVSMDVVCHREVGMPYLYFFSESIFFFCFSDFWILFCRTYPSLNHLSSISHYLICGKIRRCATSFFLLLVSGKLRVFCSPCPSKIKDIVSHSSPSRKQQLLDSHRSIQILR